MPLDHDEIKRLILSGTLRLPYPAPVTGTVKIIRKPFPTTLKNVKVPERDYLVLSWQLGDTIQVTATVLVEDLQAIKGKLIKFDKSLANQKSPEGRKAAVLQDLGLDPETPVDWLKIELQAVVNNLLGIVANELILLVNDAVIHVPETAHVLLDVQRGVEASQIADYIFAPYPCDTIRRPPPDI
jgi:hypothetical protein